MGKENLSAKAPDKAGCFVCFKDNKDDSMVGLDVEKEKIGNEFGEVMEVQISRKWSFKNVAFILIETKSP